MPRLRFRVALVLIAGVLSLALFFSYSPDDGPNSSQFSSYSWSSDRESAFEQQRSYMIPSAQGDIHIADSGSTACFTNAPGPRIQPFFAYDRNLYDQPKMDFVKEMMVHAWKNYERFAWGADELHPVSKKQKNWYGNFSLMSTPVDALDTLYIMGLSEEYTRAKSLILRKLDFSKIDAEVSFFETTIRVLGGLLSAYELDGDIRLVKKAEELAKRLLPAFETQTGIPYSQINLKTGLFGKDSYVDMKKTTQIAEAGTLQLEFQYLSDITGNPIYAEKALFAMEQILATKKPVKGLYPRDIFVEDLEFADEIYEIGAGADSFYEYLLKLWLSTGDDRYWEVYYDSAQAMRDKMARVSDDGKYVYIPGTTRYANGNHETWYRDNTFHHLVTEIVFLSLPVSPYILQTCFAGGMFALGALARRTGNWTDHLSLGKRITGSCFESYNSTRTGLGPELADVSGGFTYASMWIMRPEAIESIFYMWRFTHDPIYREMGWTIAKNINKWSRVPNGFTGIEHVDSFRPGYHPDTGEKLNPKDPPPTPNPSAYRPNMYVEEVRVAPSAEYPYADAVFRNDVQESFFLAETLKYLYLLFAGDDVIPLEDFVFNTEAHPISVRGRGRRRDASKWLPLPVPDGYVEEKEWTDAEVVHRNLGGGDVSWLRRFWRVKDAYGGTKAGTRRRVKFHTTPGTSRNYTLAETQKRAEAVEKLEKIERSKMEETYRVWEAEQRRKKNKLFGKPKEKLDSSVLDQDIGDLQDRREDNKYRAGSYIDPKKVRPMRPDGPDESGKPADVYYGSSNPNFGQNADRSSSPALSDEQPPAKDNVSAGKEMFEAPQKLSTPPSMSGKDSVVSGSSKDSVSGSNKAARPADEDVDHSPAAAAAFNSADDDDDENTVSGVAHVGKEKGGAGGSGSEDAGSEHELSPAGQAAMAAGDGKKKEDLVWRAGRAKRVGLWEEDDEIKQRRVKSFVRTKATEQCGCLGSISSVVRGNHPVVGTIAFRAATAPKHNAAVAKLCWNIQRFTHPGKPGHSTATSTSQCFACLRPMHSQENSLQPCGACTERNRACTFTMPRSRRGRPRKKPEDASSLPDPIFDLPAPEPVSLNNDYRTFDPSNSQVTNTSAPPSYIPTFDSSRAPTTTQDSEGAERIDPAEVHIQSQFRFTSISSGSSLLDAAYDNDDDDRVGENRRTQQQQQQQLLSMQRELSFDDDLPPLPDWTVQNMLIKNGMRVLSGIPSFYPSHNQLGEFPPLLYWSLQAAAIPFCSEELETHQMGLSLPHNAFVPLLERIRRSLGRVLDPYDPCTNGNGVVSTAFASLTPEMWASFFSVERHLLKTILAACMALWFYSPSNSVPETVQPKDENYKRHCRMLLSLGVDYSKRLGLHEHIPPPHSSAFDIQRTFDEMEERRTLWWSMFVFERVFLPLDEPVIRFTMARSLPIPDHSRRHLTTPMVFGSLFRNLARIPDFDPTLIAPLLHNVYLDETMAGRAQWRALRAELYKLCISTQASKRACERLRGWAAAGTLTLHVAALSPALARECMQSHGEWWVPEGPVEEAEWGRMMRGTLDDEVCESGLEMDEDESEKTQSRLREQRRGACRLARLRRVVRRIETVFAYNEYVNHETQYGGAGRSFNTADQCGNSQTQSSDRRDGEASASSNEPSPQMFFWDLPEWHKGLNMHPFISMPSILTIAHSPSHILESLVQIQARACKTTGRPHHGIAAAIRDSSQYNMLVRWARARYGGQLCWMQTRTLMRRMCGLVLSLERSEARDLESLRINTGTTVRRAKSAENLIELSFESISHSVPVVWRAVAMTVVAWGLWEDLGETETMLVAATSGCAGSDMEGFDDMVVDVGLCKGELKRGLDTVSRWMAKTTRINASNERYYESLQYFRALVF
ncbi:hypothetical protein BJ742DRAFT_735508 [Cladochytrium replicatum]|nr:hypothetical protein BJ742DRAFT_735508 [Cladochytrium replicatum]